MTSDHSITMRHLRKQHEDVIEQMKRIEAREDVMLAQLGMLEARMRRVREITNASWTPCVSVQAGRIQRRIIRRLRAMKITADALDAQHRRLHERGNQIFHEHTALFHLSMNSTVPGRVLLAQTTPPSPSTPPPPAAPTPSGPQMGS